jgi:hypothetical protein
MNKASIQEELKQQIVKRKQELEVRYNVTVLLRDEIIEFCLDTFAIEKELELKLRTTGNMFDRELALNDAVYAYNRLVGKYVDLLGNYLTEQDLKTLRQSQQSWLDYKRHEFRLIENMAKISYPQGKEMDNYYITARVKELNRLRADELYRYFILMAGKK